MMRTYRAGMTGLVLWGAVLALAAAPALAENDKVAVAFTPTAAVAGLFNGHYEGYFAKGGIDTTLLMQSNSVGVVAAVQAGQAEIGSAATGVFFGAVQHGLDYVALGCQTTFGPGSDVLGVIPRNGVTITSPADFVGKRVAVPGVNGGTHVAFMEWLREKGVDPHAVTYVEVKYPQQADILRGTTVDAVVTSEPYMARIVQAGLGKVYSHLNDTTLSVPDSFYFAQRSWADAHPQAAEAFINGLAEGVKFANEDQQKSDENTAKALQQDVSFISAAGRQNFCGPDTAKYIKQLNTVMIGLGLATEPLDPNVVVWKKP